MAHSHTPAEKGVRRYTVVGIYADNNQNYTAVFDARDAEQAAAKAFESVDSELLVSAVFEGEHQDQLGEVSLAGGDRFAYSVQVAGDDVDDDGSYPAVRVTMNGGVIHDVEVPP